MPESVEELFVELEYPSKERQQLKYQQGQEKWTEACKAKESDCCYRRRMSCKKANFSSPCGPEEKEIHLPRKKEYWDKFKAIKEVVRVRGGN